MANVKKVVLTKNKKKKSKRRKTKKIKKSRSTSKVQSKRKSDPKAPPKLKIKSSKTVAMTKNNVPLEMATKNVTPSDYMHLYNIEKAKQNPAYVAKVKQKLAAGVTLKPKSLATKQPVAVDPAPEPKQLTEVDPLANVPTKNVAPDDYCHIYNAQDNMINGVKQPVMEQIHEPIEPPPIEVAPIAQNTVEPPPNEPSDADDQVDVTEILPADYIQIFTKDGATKIQNEENLRKAVNENVKNKTK